MLKLSLLLSLVGFSAILASGGRRRCGLQQCSNGSKYFREQNLLGIKYKDDVKRLCGDRTSDDGSCSSSSYSSSSEECGRRCPKDRDDSCSSYYSSSSCDSYSSSSDNSSSSSSPTTTPVPLRCENELKVPISNMGERIFEFLKNYQDQYDKAVVLSLTNVLSQVSGFNPIFAGADYDALAEQLKTLGVNVPANTAAELASIDSSESAALSRTIQNNAQKTVGDLLGRTSSMCYLDLMSLINSGLFASQISSAFNNIQPITTIAGNDLFAKQVAVFQKLPGPLPSAAVTAITNALQTNKNNFVTFFTTQATTLQTNVQNTVTALTTALKTLSDDTSKEFSNFANSEITALVGRIFPPSSTTSSNTESGSPSGNSGSNGGSSGSDSGKGNSGKSDGNDEEKGSSDPSKPVENN